jgi:hypothetical protein
MNVFETAAADGEEAANRGLFGPAIDAETHLPFPLPPLGGLQPPPRIWPTFCRRRGQQTQGESKPKSALHEGKENNAREVDGSKSARG